MILLNFAHPITYAQMREIIQYTGLKPIVYDIHVHIDRSQPFERLVVGYVDQIELSSTQWQTEPLLINPPGLAPFAVALLAEIHGRCGYFPPTLNIRPTPGGSVSGFEVAEIINLQKIRDIARAKR